MIRTGRRPNVLRGIVLVATAADAGRRLDVVAGEWLGRALERPLSKSAVRRLIMAGALSVDGVRRRRPGRPLRAGERLQARVDLDRLAGRLRDVPFEMTAERVLYEDRWLLAVDKPPGLPTHPTGDPSRPSLVSRVREFLARRAGGGGPPARLGVHHRLDRDTSGVVLFTLDPEADPGLARQFAGRAVVKTYHALTVRPARLPPAAWRCRDRLATAAGGRVAPDARGAPAVTDFARLQAFDRGLLVRAVPHTGRKHQIRVHLAGAGLPILGDPTYGGPGRSPDRLMLHARSLAFAHPVTGAPVTIESRYPEDFAAALERLRRGRRRG
jgi:RluA family pseudouridine synthase